MKLGDPPQIKLINLHITIKQNDTVVIYNTLHLIGSHCNLPKNKKYKNKKAFWTNSNNVLSLLVPCAPSNVTTNLVCGTNDLTVSWDSSAAPLNYTAIVVPSDGSISPVTCNTNLTSCSLNGLQCGQTYNVSVKASSGSCCGPYSHTRAVQTGNKDDDERINIAMNYIYICLLCFILHSVMSSTSTLLPSEPNSSVRVWHRLSPGLLERLSWSYLLHSDSDRAQRFL